MKRKNILFSNFRLLKLIFLQIFFCFKPWHWNKIFFLICYNYVLEMQRAGQRWDQVITVLRSISQGLRTSAREMRRVALTTLQQRPVPQQLYYNTASRVHKDRKRQKLSPACQRWSADWSWSMHLQSKERIKLWGYTQKQGGNKILKLSKTTEKCMEAKMRGYNSRKH